MSTKRKPSWSQLKKKRSNTTTSFTVVLDAAAAQQADELANQLEELAEDDPRAPELAERVRQLEQQAADSQVTFVFQGVGRSRWEQLREEHPPTDEEKAEGISAPRGFAIAALAASVVEPAELRGDLEQWAEIYDEWSNGLVLRLTNTCYQANQGANGVPKSSRASEILARNDSATN